MASRPRAQGAALARGAALAAAMEAEKEPQQRVVRFFQALFVVVLGVAIALWLQC